VPCDLTTSPFAIEHADRLLTCGDTETVFIKSRFPKAKCETVFFGSTIKDSAVGPELFQKQFGVGDFVLCVGRIEMRKNQLMLMKALEDEDIPLVFADGGFSYQPAYVDLCKNFKRKGKTIFTGRLSDELLISAFRAASVHCLPSWYELPGLVTLEAARYGCRIVASSWGAIENYLKDTIIYCQPDSSDSIREAIYAALSKPNDNLQTALASNYTWEKSGDHLIAVYTNVIGLYDEAAMKKLSQSGVFSGPLNAMDFVQRVTGFVEAGKNGDAVAFYDLYRKTFRNVPYLGKFDSLVCVMKAKRSGLRLD
jgi:glycosyltransferase involved in cell wall biosynthesis